MIVFFSSYYLSGYQYLMLHLTTLSDLLFITYIIKKHKMTEFANKLVNNPTQTFICPSDYFFFLYNLGNFLTAFFLVYNSRVLQSNLVAKNKKLSKAALYLLFYFIPTLFLFFSLTLFEIRLAISKYLAIFKCIVISK